MGLTSNKADEKTTKELNLHTGVYSFKVIKFNPSGEELKEMLGMDEVREQEYIQDDKFNEGHKQYLAYFWLENEACTAYMDGEEVDVKEGEFKIPVIFGIGDAPLTNRDGTKHAFVNKYGKTTYAESEDKLPSWFEAEGVRKAHYGEQELYNFLKSYANLYDSGDKKDENCLDDPNALFKDDSFFKNYIKELQEKNHGVKCLVELKKGAENEDGNFNVKEVIYKQYFQKKSQKMPQAIGNFKNYLSASNVRTDKEDKIARRTPKGEFYTIEPTVLSISEAKEKVSGSQDEADNDEAYKQSSSAF